MTDDSKGFSSYKPGYTSGNSGYKPTSSPVRVGGGGFVAGGSPNFRKGGGGGNNGGGGMGGGDIGLSQGPGSQGSKGQRKEREPQKLLPVSIKQLLDAEIKEGNKFRIDGQDVTQVSLVGQILQVDAQHTYVAYMIDDGTGHKISVRVYTDAADETAVHHIVGDYVRVFGSAKNFNGDKSIMGFKVLPATSNEITHAVLEIIACHLRATRPPQQNPSSLPYSTPSTSYPTSSSVRPAVKPEPMAVGHDTYGGGGHHGHGASASIVPGVSAVPVAPTGGGDNDFNPLQRQLLRIFEQDSASETGTTVAFVCQQLPNFTQAEIRKAIEFLSDEGHLYSTVDDDHFKSTSMS